jgi:hypothetical protein
VVSRCTHARVRRTGCREAPRAAIAATVASADAFMTSTSMTQRPTSSHPGSRSAGTPDQRPRPRPGRVEGPFGRGLRALSEHRLHTRSVAACARRSKRVAHRRGPLDRGVVSDRPVSVGWLRCGRPGEAGQPENHACPLQHRGGCQRRGRGDEKADNDQWDLLSRVDGPCNAHGPPALRLTARGGGPRTYATCRRPDAMVVTVAPIDLRQAMTS